MNTTTLRLSRYVQKASLPDISHIAALFVGQSIALWDCLTLLGSVRGTPAEKSSKIKTILQGPCDSKGHTHTHTLEIHTHPRPRVHEKEFMAGRDADIRLLHHAAHLLKLSQRNV